MVCPTTFLSFGFHVCPAEDRCLSTIKNHFKINFV
jgi:hypothetical protein